MRGSDFSPFSGRDADQNVVMGARKRQLSYLVTGSDGTCTTQLRSFRYGRCREEAA
jgi:hypothetical protein